jgi:hypothetical protein
MTKKKDKPNVSRRKVLGSLGTVGAVSGVGAGSWALVSDTEINRFFWEGSPGDEESCDLTKNGESTDGTGVIRVPPEGSTIFEPGTTQEIRETLGNQGNVPGTQVCFELPSDSVVSDEGQNYPNEGDTDTSNGGELEDTVSLTLSLESSNRTYVVYEGSYAGLAGQSVCQPLAEEDWLQPDGGSTVDMVITAEVPSDNTDIFGDTLQFDLEVTLQCGDPTTVECSSCPGDLVSGDLVAEFSVNRLLGTINPIGGDPSLIDLEIASLEDGQLSLLSFTADFCVNVVGVTLGGGTSTIIEGQKSGTIPITIGLGVLTGVRFYCAADGGATASNAIENSTNNMNSTGETNTTAVNNSTETTQATENTTTDSSNTTINSSS